MKYQPLILLLMGYVIMLSTASDILIYPMVQGVPSRLLNMEKLAIILADNGHNVTILINSRARPTLTTEKVFILEYIIPEDHWIPTNQEVQDKMIHGFTFEAMDFLITNFMLAYCRPLLEQQALLESLKNQHFDLFFLDMLDVCLSIISDYLGIPTLLYSNNGFITDPRVFYPILPSFVPFGDDGESYNDRMNFVERLSNTLLITSMAGIWQEYLHWRLDHLRVEYNISASKRSRESFRDSLVIVPGSFVLEFPRPIMPHVILIPGLFLQEPKPLDNDWAAIMKSSSEHGVIVMSIGTYFNIEHTAVEIFSRVFAHLPYTVIWQYLGPKPKHPGDNTKLGKWLPQNDLLAHPKVKLFITHCGISSTYEAVQHTVPVVAIPIAYDQHRNAAYLVNRAEMGVKVNLKTLTEDTLYSAIIHVLSNSTYRDNAVKTRALLMDSPVPAKDLFLYWVEYVIRHKGAKHLISEAAHELNFLQYHSIDVATFLIIVCLSVLVLILGIAYCTLKLIIHVLCGEKKSKQA